jgi:hypothetical protein
MPEKPMKLTLRELFLLVVIAAMGCGWWVESSRLRRQVREANEKLEEASKQMEQVIRRAIVSY